jgi:uncharacterized membrane protein
MAKEKKTNTFLTGVLTLLPLVLFCVIIVWVFDWILGLVGRITSLFPQSFWNALGLPEIVVNFLGFLILCGIVWLVGFVVKIRFGKKLKGWIGPFFSKIPLLNSLIKITNQITDTLKDTKSFKKVVLVRFPTESTWSVGFITGDNPEIFDNELGNPGLVSIFIPTTPNPTNGFLVLMSSDDYRETEIPVATAISFIISMGTAGAANEVLKKSYPSSE